MRLKDKVAIITGGASGIGRASAQLFAKEGAKVVVADINKTDGQKLAREITNGGGEAVFIQTDVTKTQSISEMVDSVREKYGRIDILFNNVGYFGISGTVVDLKEEDWDFMMNINLKSMFLVSKHVIPEMLKQGKGTIVNTASDCSFIGTPGESAYCAAKGGVLMMTKAMALDYATKNIRVNAVAPCNIDTPMFNKYLDKYGPEVRNEVLKLMPMHRFGKPEEIATVALFLASDESSYLTGTTIVADSGFTSQ